jgi:hypothetical protein
MVNLNEYFPRASKDFLAANPVVSNPVFEPHKEAALGGAAKRKAKSVERVVVRFTGYRVRPLDPDNFAGSTKDLIDGLRRAKLLHDDSWKDIRLETEQEKVKTFAEERTVIEIIYP